MLSLIILLFVLWLSVLMLNTAQPSKYALENTSEHIIMIYIDEKKLYLFENDKCIKEYPIASGKSESPSPIGYWKITEKKDWGGAFGGRWLGLNVLWGKYGIHGTSREGSIGHAASHGCIRMYNKDIREIFSMVSVGTPVIISDGDFGLFGSGFRQLRPGDRGADVLAVQNRLEVLGYFEGKANGIYENDLKSALYDFQKDKNLRVKYTITHDDYIAMGFKEFE